MRPNRRHQRLAQRGGRHVVTARVRTEERHPSDLGRGAGGEPHGGATAERDAEQIDLPRPDLFRQSLERLDLGWERRFDGSPVRQAGADAVVADEPVAACEPGDERAQIWEAPFQPEVADPQRRQDQRWTRSNRGVGDPAGSGLEEPDLLIEPWLVHRAASVDLHGPPRPSARRWPARAKRDSAVRGIVTGMPTTTPSSPI